MMIFRAVLFVFIFATCARGQVQFRVLHQWKYVNYTWPNAESLQMAKSSGRYVPQNIVISGTIYHAGWFYLTMPRMKSGVPATLGRISAQHGKAAPLIDPFPSWELNEEGNCEALQNVQNVEVGPNERLWIVDGGHVESLTRSASRKCPPKVIIFDIAKNAIELSYTFPLSVVGNGSFLYDLVLDDDYAYITDNSGRDPGIVVFSSKDQRSWKIRHDETMRGKDSDRFVVSNVTISGSINIGGIAITPKIANYQTRERNVYYSPISSRHLYAVSNSVLKNENNSNNGQEYPGTIEDLGLKQSQSDGMIMTNKGALYYGLLTDNSIARWDAKTPLKTGEKVIARDSQFIQWINSFTIDGDDNLIVLTDTLQKFIFEKLDVTARNFWLLSGNISEKSYLHEYEESENDESWFSGTKVTSHPYVRTTTISPSISTISAKIETTTKGTAVLPASNLFAVCVAIIVLYRI